MYKFPLPVMLPATAKISVTQPFGKTDNAIEPKGPNGEPHFHYGVDLVFGTTEADSYGVPIVCPFDNGSLDSYLSTTFNGSQTPFVEIAGVGASGNRYQAVFAHCSAEFYSARYNSGTIVGLTGNFGAVSPVPTPTNPLAGSHLHFGLRVNGSWVNPLDYFDLSQWHVGPAVDPNSQLSRWQWAVEQLKAQLAVLEGIK